MDRTDAAQSFPNQIEHTIQWAKEHFNDYFTAPAEAVNTYLSQPNFLETAKATGVQPDQIKQIHSNLVDRPLGFDQCIAWARLKFEEDYASEIKQLLHSLPRDLVTKEGVPFWSGPKRAPNPIAFNPDNDEHMTYVIAAANLRAFNYGLKGEADPAYFRKKLAEVRVPEFVPRAGVQVQVKDDEPVSNGASTSDEDLSELIAALPAPSTLAGVRRRIIASLTSAVPSQPGRV